MEEHKQTVVVTCLVSNAVGQILLIRHFRRGWELHQGRVEAGETLTEAVHREVAEETGVEIELGSLAAVWSKVCEPAAIIFGFTGNYRRGHLTVSEESPEVSWFAPDEALSRVIHLVNRDRLQTLLDHCGGIVYNAYLARPFRVLEASSRSCLLIDSNADEQPADNVNTFAP